MRNLLRDLSVIGKVVSGVGALGGVPYVNHIGAFVLLVLAILFKDLADNFYQRVETLTATLREQASPALTEALTALPQ